LGETTQNLTQIVLLNNTRLDCFISLARNRDFPATEELAEDWFPPASGPTWGLHSLSAQFRTIQVYLSTPNPIAVIVGPTPMGWLQELLKSLIRWKGRNRALRSRGMPRAAFAHRVRQYSGTGGGGSNSAGGI